MSDNLIISGQSLSKSFGKHQLFSGISLGFFYGERLGFIGPNGSGKSTLLKIFAGLETSDSGKIAKKRDTHLVYLPQNDFFESDQTIEQTLSNALPASLEDTERFERVRQITRQMKFPSLEQKVETLSGGWKKRLAIARAFIQEPDLLLMDEPTNHLDIEGILWLEQVLKAAKFAFVLVSHDRFFLENTTHRTLELNQTYPDGYFKVEGPYSEFLEKREAFIQEQNQMEQVLSNQVRRELEWLHRGPKARSTKAKFRMDKAYELQKELSEVHSRNTHNQKAQIDFDATHRKTKKLLETQSLGMIRNEQTLFSNLDLILSPGQCLGILGKNGSGKSTLFHLLNGTLTPTSGRILKADHLELITLDQKREPLNPQLTLKQALSPRGDSVVYQNRSLHVVTWAKRFLFQSDQLGMPLAQLSGGELARVLIANLMLQPADILLLDEPTNDLDIPTLEVLEESLREFPGAILLITHDRFLMDRLSDQLLYLDGAGNAEYFADYNQWLLAQQSASMKEEVVKEAILKTPLPHKKNKLSYEELKELNRMDKKIEKAEAHVKLLQQRLNDSAIMSDADRLAALYQELQQAEAQVEQLYQRWEALDTLNQPSV